MSRALGGVACSFEDTEEVADEVLRSGGSALGAALAAFFNAAAQDGGVLFGPLTLLVSGVGIGQHAYDGRCRQPGIGGKRPRGWTDDQDIAPAARAAIPGSIPALAVAFAQHQGASLASAVRPAAAVAKKAGHPGRAEFLQLVAGRGATVLQEPSVRRSWLAEFGPVEGGLATVEDLSPPLDLRAEPTDDGRALSAPWNEAQTAQEQGAPDALGQAHACLAIDAQGMQVALCFWSLTDALRLPRYQLSVPALGVPVRRGVPRLAPGTSLAVPTCVQIESVGGVSRVVARLPRGELALTRDAQTKRVTRS